MVAKPSQGGKNSIKNQAFKQSANLLRKFDKKARPLFLGEFHISGPILKNHAFTGSGTRVDIPAVRNFPPINQIDACSRTHDFSYESFKKLTGEARRKAIRQADLKALKCYDRFKTVGGYTLARNGIAAKIALENNTPSLARSLLGDLSSV